MPIPHKLIQCNTNQSPNHFFYVDKLILKLICKYRRNKITETTFTKRNKARGLMLVTPQCGISVKIDRLKKQNRELKNRPTHLRTTDFQQRCKDKPMEKE